MRLFDLRENRVLKTQKGSAIRRSKWGVGKVIGGRIYVHRDYVDRLPEPLQRLYSDATQAMQGVDPNFRWNATAIDLKGDKVTLMEAPDFDTADEPHVGVYWTVAPGKPPKRGQTSQIWHHKWLWVDDDYRGFDVDQSFERSRKWLAIPDIPFAKIGKDEFWQKFIAGKL